MSPSLFAIARVVLFSFVLRGIPAAFAQSLSMSLEMPSAVAYDAQGDLYFAERTGHVVHRLAPDGTLALVAGTGTQGFSGDNGPATAAQLDSPQGLAVDADGNLYIADTHNHRVRRVAAVTGVISTIAGTGQPGFAGDNGAASFARLNSPSGLAVDGSGNIWVADTGNHRIRRIAAATGLIATAAGSGAQGFAGDNGPATDASIDSPAGLSVDAAGNLFFADTHNHRIRRVDAITGRIATIAGTSVSGPGLPGTSGDNGPATVATLALPRGLALDGSGNLYIADSANQRIRRIAPDGTITTVAGQGTEGYAGDNGTPSSALLDSPQGIALSAAGALTVVDAHNARLRQVISVNSTAPEIQTVVGPGANLSLPRGVLSLAGPATVAYGSGSVTATLSGGAAAGGSVTFLENFEGGTSPLGDVRLVNGTATLVTSALAAGVHNITANYSGDGSHAAVRSQLFPMTVTALPVTATSAPASMIYGQPIPVLTGSLQGVLAQDVGKVSAVFSSFAAGIAPAGLYPISASLSGPAAGNYTLGGSSGTLTISKAPVTVTISPSSLSPAPGSALTLMLSVLSGTAGVPTGTVTVLDGSSVVGQSGVTSGAAAFTVPNLTAGSHSFAAVYSGDANFLPGSFTASALTVGSSQDFTFAAAGSSSQTVPSGSAASYTFSLDSQSAQLSSPITLAVTGLPAGASASLNPAYIPPGGAVTTFTLTVQTTKTLAAAPPQELNGGTGAGLASMVLAPLFLAMAGFGRARGGGPGFPRLFRKKGVIFAVLGCITSATLASGCATRVNTASEAQTTQTYIVTVTGTATSATGTVLQHSVNVTLQVL